jgi:phosphoserine phosphatase
MSEINTRTDVVVFCDLDGTIVLDNSFHIFISSIWCGANFKQKLSFSLLILTRLLGSASGGHAGFKRRILNWFGEQNSRWKVAVVDRVLRRLKATISEAVMREILSFKEQGAQIVLATAAPDIYARAMGLSIGVDHCIATDGLPGEGWQELVGPAKAEACRLWLETNRTESGPHIVVITDHRDDLPLMAMADEVVIQAVTSEIASISETLAPHSLKLRPLDVAAAQSDGGYWLWFDDRPKGPLDIWEVYTILSKHRHAQIYEGRGRWRRIGPGNPLAPAVLRRDCPRPPTSRERILIYYRRRLLRDWLGLFH